MAKSVFIGIDLGTSSAKILTLDETGTVLHKATCPYPTQTPQPQFAEQNPHDWKQAVAKGFRQVLQETCLDSVQGIGVSGQLNGLVLLNETGEPIHHAIIWLDRRAESEIPFLKECIGGHLQKISCNRLDPIAVFSKLFLSQKVSH